MDVLRVDRERHFEVQLLQILRAEYPGWEESHTERSLSDLVHEAIVAARAMGVTWETELADFVGLYLEIGQGFQQHALVQAVFNDSGVDVNRKVEAMFDRFTPGDWESIRLESKELDRSAVPASK